jgi:hypothetical protein
VRSIYTPNDYTIDGEITTINIYDKKCNLIGTCKIDTDKLNVVSSYKWHYDKQKYIVTIQNKSRISMHRMIMDYPEGLYVDHINSDKSDNRVSNLRIVDAKKNVYNVGLRSTNTSGVKGVNVKRDYGWEARCEINNCKTYHRKAFRKFDDAVIQRVAWEAENHGVYSNNYNHSTSQLEIHYLNPQDNLPTTIHMTLDGTITLFTKHQPPQN